MFVLVLSMAYRYIFHLFGAVTDMYTARKARMVGATGSGTGAGAGARDETAAGRRFVAASAGALFGKAHALSEEVHLAMVSRGYTGQVRTLARTRITARDVVWAATCVAAVILVIGADHALGR
jgi:cobalt/nickel transport system permease protein